LADTLTAVCHHALVGLPSAKYAGISMTIDGRLGTYVFSDPEVIEIDYSQYEAGEGPCVDAFRTGKTVLVDSTFEPGPFPAFRHTAVRHGVHSALAVPLIAADATIGALNLFADREHGFDRQAITDATAFATQAAFVLANSKAYWDARTLSDNLTVAMASRAEIEQAKGIIMGAMGIDSQQAFETLKQQSQHENIKLKDIASELVHRSKRDGH
jgi:GAF domain-containing protein